MRWPLPAHWHAALCRQRLARDIDAKLAVRAKERRPAPPETKRFERARPKVEQLRHAIAMQMVDL
ncbi:MAG: hypothetical protein INR68_18420 [Methylobacterium mesophilicum]|nr:hypothetical protein [Methylobacterium mesophilicum]